jgi:hypothetical protein
MTMSISDKAKEFVRNIVTGEPPVDEEWMRLVEEEHEEMERIKVGDNEYYCGLHGVQPLEHFPCSG